MSQITAMFNGKLGNIGKGPNFVRYELCRRTHAAMGNEVPAELAELAREVEALHVMWRDTVQQYDDAARGLRERATAAMKTILEEG